MAKRTVKSITGEVSYEFFERMAHRMDFSYSRYGNFRRNYNGMYTEEFLKDATKTLRRLVARWKGKGTSAKGNAVMFCLERLLFYLDGGWTRKGKVDRGNTEYLADAANGLMIESACPQVPDADFKSNDDGKTPGFSGFSERELRDFCKEGDDD
jgi:hypothetical protein